MKCHNCNKTYNDKLEFCPHCGERKAYPNVCPKCIFITFEDIEYCPECKTLLYDIRNHNLLNKLDLATCGLEGKEKLEERLKILEKILEAAPYFTASWIEKADVLKSLNRFEEAIECYDKIIELDSKNHYIWKFKGECLEKLEKHEEAKECFEKAKIPRN